MIIKYQKNIRSFSFTNSRSKLIIPRDLLIYYLILLTIPWLIKLINNYKVGIYVSNKENDDIYNNNTYIVPKIVWMFWEGNMSNITRFMLHNIKSISNEYNIIFLNQNTVRDYIDSLSITSDIIKLRMCQQADFYRFNLIYNYGGIWLDANVYIKNEEYFNECFEELYQKKADLLAYNAFYHPLNNIEIGVLMGRRRGEFIGKIIDEWKYGMKIGRKEYMRKRINQGVVIKNKKIYNPDHIDKKNNKKTQYYGVYFFSYVCLQYVLQIKYNNDANIITHKAEEWMYKYLYDNDNNYTFISDRWMNDLKEKNYPITVLTHNIRKRLKDVSVEVI